MKVRDSKRRKVMDEAGTEYLFNFRRFQCEQCKKLHTEIPDCVIPQKQYSKRAIADVLNGKCNYYVADNSTVWRWKKSQYTPDMQ